MSAISIRDVTYVYPSGVTALNGVDLDIAAGENVAIIGENGAGKTTLVRHLNGIHTPTSGRIRIGDADTADRSIAQLSATVGYVFQNPADQLFARTVRADVEFGPRNLGRGDDEVRRLTGEALEATGLSGHADHHPYHLSPAERKRVALASVLAMDTSVVVLDEPTTGQDHAAVTGIARIIADLRERGKTVIAITHDMDFCAENFARVVAMARGGVIADGTPGEVFAHTEELEQARVEPPQMLRLAAELGWGTGATTVPEFLATLREQATAR